MTWPLDCVRRHEPLANHTSFRIGGPARWMLRPRDAGQAAAALVEAATVLFKAFAGLNKLLDALATKLFGKQVGEPVRALTLEQREKAAQARPAKVINIASIDGISVNPQETYSYAASKAAADLLVRSYFETYKMPVTISRCSNNFGPYQFPEKLIPYFFFLMTNDKPVPAAALPSSRCLATSGSTAWPMAIAVAEVFFSSSANFAYI